MNLTFAEMFSGPGGMSLGAGQAATDAGLNLEHLWSIDYNAKTCRTYAANIFGDEDDPRAKCWDVRKRFERDEHGDFISDPFQELACPDVFAFGFPCFSAGTLILTHRGYSLIETLLPGDLVLTHRGRWRRVLRVFETQNVPLIGLTGRGVNRMTVTTAEHPFYTLARDSDEASWVNTTGLCAKKHMLTRAIPTEQLPVPGFFDSPFRAGRLELFGTFVACGRIIKRKRRTWASVRVRSAGGSEHLFSLGSSAGVEMDISDSGDQMFFSGDGMAEGFAAAADLPAVRSIPGWCIALPTHDAKDFVRGWMLGASRKSNDRHIGSTSSLSEAFGIAHVCATAFPDPSREGYVPVVYAMKESGRCDVHFLSVHEHFRESRCGYVAYGLKDVVDLGRLGTVYNLEVEEDNSYHADGYAVHNCNDFSQIGERKGLGGTFGPLFSYGIEVIRHCRPAVFVAENVAGLSGSGTQDGVGALDLILNEMESSGYTLVPHLYRAEDYGVPQTRHRIVIVGIRSDLDVRFMPPSPTTLDAPITASRALAGMDGPMLNHERQTHTSLVVERLTALPPGENAWWDGLPEHLRIKTDKVRLSNIYRKLHPDKPSYTVTGHGGGGTSMYHWDEPRALTNRERARLQGFPDDFKFVGSLGDVRGQIGMAVPPPLARAVFQAVFKSLVGQAYATTEPSARLQERGSKRISNSGVSKAMRERRERDLSSYLVA